MSDPTKLSDAELMAALGGAAAPQPSGMAAMSDADLMKALGQGPSVAMDVAKSAGSGIAKGAVGLAGTIGDAASWLGNFSDNAGNYIAGKMGFEQSPVLRNPIAENAGSASIGKAVDTLAGAPVTSYQPQTTAGKYAKTAGEFIPGAMIGPGGMTTKVVGYGIIPGLASEAAGQATAGTAAEPYARVAAALAASTLPSLASKAITPLPISAERQKLVDALSAEGVPLTAGQKTGSKPLQYAESFLSGAPGGGGKAAAVMEGQSEAFTDAAMRRAGSSGRATADNLQANYQRLGDQFTDLAARNTLRADPQLGGDINTALQQYGRKLPSEQRALVGNEAVEIIQRLQTNGGTMPGREYQKIRSDLTRRAHNNRTSDPDFADALRGLRNALDENMARSISPEDAAAWSQARQQWGAQKTLEKTAAAGGENAAAGLVSPAQLRVAAAAGNRSAYARGQGDFAELARAGNALMTPLPNSGTAQRLNIAQLLGAVAGGAAGGFAGAAAGAAAPGIAGRVIMSSPVQAWLGNQMLKDKTPAVERIAQALLAARSAGVPMPR